MRSKIKLCVSDFFPPIRRCDNYFLNHLCEQKSKFSVTGKVRLPGSGGIHPMGRGATQLCGLKRRSEHVTVLCGKTSSVVTGSRDTRAFPGLGLGANDTFFHSPLSLPDTVILQGINPSLLATPRDSICLLQDPVLGR